MEGFIKIHRQVLDWEWYDDSIVVRVFFHLLLKANYKDKKYRGESLPAGTVLTGRDLLSKELNISVRQVRTALEKLEYTNEVTIKTSTKGTRIQLVNYSKYQLSTNERPTSDQLATNKRPTSDQQTTTNKKGKKEKKEKKAITCKNEPTLEEFIDHAKKRKPDVNPEEVRLKYFAWRDNDWCINRKGKNVSIVNWKSTLTNTLKFLGTVAIKENLTNFTPELEQEHNKNRLDSLKGHF